MKEEILTLEEVAKYLKIPTHTIYKLSQRGDLPSFKVGKRLRFNKKSLDKWMAKNENIRKNRNNKRRG